MLRQESEQRRNLAQEKVLCDAVAQMSLSAGIGAAREIQRSDSGAHQTDQRAEAGKLEIRGRCVRISVQVLQDILRDVLEHSETFEKLIGDLTGVWQPWCAARF